MKELAHERFGVNTQVPFAKGFEEKTEGFQVAQETFRGDAQKCRRKGGIAKMPFRVLLHANRRAHIGGKGRLIVDHEKPFKDVEVGFDGSPTQVLAVCSLYVFLQR